jgi:hypothetical protein
MLCHEAIQTYIEAGGLLVSVVTLLFLIIYVRATKGIEKAANEQSEGLAKPVIVVESSGVNSSVEAILSGGLFSEIGDGGVRLINIGTGPALWLEWSATGKRYSDKGPCGSAGFVPYLTPGQPIPAGCSRGFVSGLSFLTVECKYRSLSGTHYVSRTVIGDENSSQQWDRFRIKSFEMRRTQEAPVEGV